MIRLRIFGKVELLRDDGSSVASVQAQPKRLALLARLAVPAPGTFHRRDVLIALLWPELDDARGRGALNTAVHFLRQSLGGDVLVRRGHEELGLDPRHLGCDAADFLAAQRSGDLDAADRLYGGAFLDGFHVDGAAEFERWVEEERVSFLGMALSGAQAGRARADGSGDVEAAVRWAERAAGLAPLDEVELRELILRLDRSGRRPQALEAFDGFQARLAADLELAPSEETKALVRELRTQPPEPALPIESSDARRARPPGAALTHAAPPRLATRYRVALAMAALVGTAAIVTRVGSRRPEPSPPDPDRVAILPFLVHGDSTLNYMGEGIVDLLGDRLGIPGRLHPVDSRALILAERSERPSVTAPADGVTAARFGAGLYVVGSIARVASRIELAASLHETNGPHRVTARVSVPSEDSLAAGVDELARRLLAGLYESEGERLARTGALTAASLPALRAYLSAQRDFREGRFDAALEGFRAATALDSTMAVAYYGIVLAAEWSGSNDFIPAALDRAWALRDGLPEPVRLLLEARRTPGAADKLRMYRSTLVLYPDLVEAWYEVADLLFHYGHWGISAEEVRAAFERVLSYDPRNADALLHLARVAAAERDEGALLEVSRSLLLVAGADAGERGVEVRALHAMAFGDAPEVATAILDVLRLDEEAAVRIGSRLARYGGRAHEVGRLFDALESSIYAPETRAFARVMRAVLLASQGRPREGFALLDPATSPDPRVTAGGIGILATAPGTTSDTARLRTAFAAVEAWKDAPTQPLTIPSGYIGLVRGDTGPLLDLSAGLIAADLGEVATAADLARRLEGLAASDAAALVWSRLALDDPGRALAEMGRTSEKQYYDAAALEAFHRAETLLRLGDAAGARRWFAAFAHEHPFSFIWFPPAWLASARLAEAAGDEVEAARYYRRFLEAWGAAEPEQRAAVEEARARLKALGG